MKGNLMSGIEEGWLDKSYGDACLLLCIHTATQAVETAQQLMRLFANDGQQVNGLKRISDSAHPIRKAMLERPMASPTRIAC